MAKPRSPRCPTCREPVQFEVGVARPSWAPFCSERCKLIDLGRWLGEEHRIPGPPADLADLESLASGSDGGEFDEQ